MQVFLKSEVDEAVGRLPELTKNGTLILRQASFYDSLDPNALRMWCHLTGRYGLVTEELVDWIRSFIAGRPAIEIGSGCGDLAWHLNIMPTDSRIMEQADVKLYYEFYGQPLTAYPEWVAKLEALDAVAIYKPQVVIASWVTQLITEADELGTGSMYGVDESELLRTGVTYIFIGNEKVHCKKRIMAQPHKSYALPFLRSKAEQPELNRVWIWNQ